MINDNKPYFIGNAEIVYTSNGIKYAREYEGVSYKGRIFKNKSTDVFETISAIKNKLAYYIFDGKIEVIVCLSNEILSNYLIVIEVNINELPLYLEYTKEIEDFKFFVF